MNLADNVLYELRWLTLVDLYKYWYTHLRLSKSEDMLTYYIEGFINQHYSQYR